MCEGCCAGLSDTFNATVARRDLRRFRRRGPDESTRRLLAALQREGVAGTVLDIGGGIGAIHHDLLEHGATSATHVDASPAYLEAARDETARRGHADRVTFVAGDFTAVAPDVPAADVVTLDRVICCYPDADALVRASASHARRLYGLVFPRETWWMQIVARCMNVFLRARGSAFRFFLHHATDVDARARDAGLEPARRDRTLIWQVVVYVRAASGIDGAAPAR